MNTKLNSEKHAYLYSRVSRGAQVKGTGLTRQDIRGEQICKQFGWILETETFSDPGKSAFKGTNLLKGDLARFIDLAKTNKLKQPTVLIIEQWDRFSRMDIDTSFDEARNLLKSGVDICVAGFGFCKVFSASDLNDLPSRIGMELSMQQAWQYSHNLSNRVNAAFQRKYQLASEGKAVQLGYWQPTWIDFIGENKSIGRFEKNQIATVIYGIAIDYVNNKSMLQIANELNIKKVPCIGRGNKKGVEWTQGQIAYLLHSESLIGTIEISGHRFEKYYPAILTEEEWNKLQYKLRMNKDKKGGNRQGQWISNLFPGKVICSNCGGTVSTQNGKCGNVIQRFYKCSTARFNTTKCNVRRMIPISNLEEDFFILQLNQHPSQLTDKNTNSYELNISKVNNQINDIDKLITEAVELLGKIPAKALEAKLTALNNEKQNLIQEREELNHTMINVSNAPEALTDIKKAIQGLEEEFITTLEQVQKALQDPDIRSKLVKLLPNLVDHLTVDLVNKQYTITYLDGKTTNKEYIGN